MGEFEQKQRIKELIKRYDDFRLSHSPDEMKKITEADIRANYIDPLFEILGWDVKNPDEYNREHYIRSTGFADVALKIENNPVIFLEAKRIGGIKTIEERGVGDWTLEERQVLFYAISKKCQCTYAILTNFQRFRVFNALTGLTILNFDSYYDYINRFSELQYLSKDNVKSGKIERLAKRVERSDIDPEFLDLLKKWREVLANEIFTNVKNSQIFKFSNEKNLELLKDAVQRILDRLIIIRWAEDHLIFDDSQLLEKRCSDWKKSPTYNSLYDSLFADRCLFDKINEIHNGKIFERGDICDKVVISDEVLSKIIDEMTQCSFRKFDFDILGNTYESYLGYTLALKEDNSIKLKPSMETRKESGIYYTPPFVVDFIIKNTLGELLKSKSNNEVKKIKILDPSCGSGSFLIRAYDYIKNYYDVKNEELSQERATLIKKYISEKTEKNNQVALDNNFFNGSNLDNIESQILKNNIFGVDLDKQAAEISSVNLMLKSLKEKRKLPAILNENILVGNSIISGHENELKPFFGDNWDLISPLNWEEQFLDIFNPEKPVDQRGFDVVIGNPPYFKMEGRVEEQKYFENMRSELYRGKNDVYYYFIAKGIDLLKNSDSYLGFIVERYFSDATFADKLRHYILKNTSIKILIDFGEVQIFPDAGNHTCIVILQKRRNENNIIKVVKVKKPKEKKHFLKLDFGKKVSKELKEKFASVRANKQLMDHIINNLSKDRYDDEFIEIFQKNQNLLNSSPWVFSSEHKSGIKKRIEENSWDLIELCVIEQGQKTGLNSVFCVTEKEISKYNLERELLRKLIKNSDINRYFVKWKDFFLIYINDDIEIEKYPNTKQYFEKFRDKLEARAEVKEGMHVWYRLQRPREARLFNAVEKIIVPYRASENRFALDNQRLYGLTDTHVIIPLPGNIVNIEFILAVLNSKLLNYYYKFIGRPKGNMFEYFVDPLSKIPIRKIDMKNPNDKKHHDELVNLVNTLIILMNNLNTIDIDFKRHVSVIPIINYYSLKRIFDKIPIEKKEVLFDPLTGKSFNVIDGKINDFKIFEEGDLLIFNIGYTYLSSKGARNIKDTQVLKIKIDDKHFRKFLYYYLTNFVSPNKIGKGNILQNILKIKIPQFSLNEENDKKILCKLMEPYVNKVGEYNEILKEIQINDKKIDDIVFKIYGIEENELN
jgi:hypothetical protein